MSIKTTETDVLRALEHLLRVAGEDAELDETDRYADAHVVARNGKLVLRLSGGEEFGIYVRQR